MGRALCGQSVVSDALESPLEVGQERTRRKTIEYCGPSITLFDIASLVEESGLLLVVDGADEVARTQLIELLHGRHEGRRAVFLE